MTLGKVIEQTLRAEFIEEDTICDECKKEFTPHTWSASIQVLNLNFSEKSILMLYFLNEI